MRTLTPKRGRRRDALLLAISIAVAGWAQAAPQLVLSENFDSVAVGSLPSGWTKLLRANGGSDISNLDANSAANWKVIDKPSDTFFSAVTGRLAYVKSDAIRPVGGVGYYDSVLTSKSFAVSPDLPYALWFTNFFRAGSTGIESAMIKVSYDGAASIFLKSFNGAGLVRQNQLEAVYFQPPAGAAQAQIIWEYNKASNNWYWGVDNVVVLSDVAPPAPPAPNLNVGPVLMGPSTSGMAVMVETTDAAPTLFYRKKGETDFISQPMAHADNELNDALIYFAPLTQLLSNTVYEYKVQTLASETQVETPLYAFKTWPTPGDVADGHQASFIAFSDTQDNRGGLFKSIIENGVMKSDRCQAADPVATCVENIKGVMVGGDFVGTGDSRSNWKTHFFDNFRALAPYVPLIPAPGNHEFYGSTVIGQGDTDAEIAKWAQVYRKYFALVPKPSTPTRYPGHYYALDYLDARIFSVGGTPMTAMHNTYGWSSPTYDYGRALFNPNYSQEVIDWMDAILTADASKKHLILLAHQPCLTTTWRGSESVLMCDLVRKVENYAEKNDALSATLVGHSHAFDAGNSMNSRHLWFTIASASGALESARASDNSDLDIFRTTRLDYGYSELLVQFGSQPRETWRRHSFSAATNPLVVGDEISISLQANNDRPQLEKVHFGGMARDAVQLRMKNVAPERIYESQWQVSRTSTFTGEVFDVWGDATRRTNLFFTTSSTAVDTRADADMLQLNLGALVSQPQKVFPFATSGPRATLFKRITPGGDELGERWQCDRRMDERQCYARLTYDGEKASPLDPFDGKTVPVLDLQDGELWYVRTRVRDKELNWSRWSDVGSFFVGTEAPFQPTQTTDIAAVSQGQASTLSVTPDALCTGTLQAEAVAVPAPEGYELPHGAVSFSLTGCAVGVKAQVHVAMAGKLSANAKLLKHHAAAGTWSEVAAQRNGNAFDYELVDGGELDEDGAQDGNLKDPYAIVVPKAPVVDLVEPVPAMGSPMVLVTALGLVALAGRRRRGKHS